MNIFWMNILDFVLNWILNWIIFRPDSMKKWFFKKDRPPISTAGRGCHISTAYECQVCLDRWRVLWEKNLLDGFWVLSWGENSQEVTLAEEEEEAVRLFTVLWQSLCTQRYLVGLTDMLPISLACCCYHCRCAHNMATGLFRMNQGDEEFTVLLVHCCTCTRRRANFKYKDTGCPEKRTFRIIILQANTSEIRFKVLNLVSLRCQLAGW